MTPLRINVPPKIWMKGKTETPNEIKVVNIESDHSSPLSLFQNTEKDEGATSIVIDGLETVDEENEFNIWDANKGKLLSVRANTPFKSPTLLK